MITDEQAEEAQDWLFQNAGKIGQAKASKAYYDERKKIIKSELFLQAKGPVAEREAKALSDEEYMNAVKEYAAAVRAEATLLARQTAEQAKIEVWRSQSANLRGKL